MAKASVEFNGPNRVGYLGPFTVPPAYLTGESPRARSPAYPLWR